jgi:hypothetical protein
MNVLNRVVEATADISGVEITPNMEGRRMVMILQPKPGVVRKAQEARKIAIAAQLANKGKPSAPDEDDLDEDEINKDVDDSDEDDEN